MIRDWKTGRPIENTDFHWRDMILEDELGIASEEWNTIVEQTAAHIREWTEQDVSERISRLITLLLPPLQTLWQGKHASLPFRALPCRSLRGATVADHALTASAIAYCLGYDTHPHPDTPTLDKLRLSALTATWKEDGLGVIYDLLWAGDSAIEPKEDGDVYERIVFLAKTAASDRQCISDATQLDVHPLNHSGQIGLVLGGATKIKDYFLESTKLPEIRGASALLDRINLEDIPALFGREITHDTERYERIRENFRERTGHALAAPECVIYAAGGNTLAFTPVSVVHEIADEIERIYTQETLVANSVAVGDAFDLLELQYGLKPTYFFSEGFQKIRGTSEPLKECYGIKADEDFSQRKCFGELTTKLSQEMLHRREGNPSCHRKTRRDLPTYLDIGPYQQRCESCERRPAVINTPRLLCEACTRKYVVGRLTKKKNEIENLRPYLKGLGEWNPLGADPQNTQPITNWSSLFEHYLEETGKKNTYIGERKELEEVDGPQDLDDIAKASVPENYITFIYADGNNMGGYLENIETPAQYRQFSERVFIALQRATFDALAEHLRPMETNIHPFEIVSIGGDDLLLIAPGSAGFDLAQAIGTNFDSEFNSHAKFMEIDRDKMRQSQRYTSDKWADEQDMQPAFSLSLGFVIADQHTPIGFLEHLASSLLKSAKARAKTLKNPDIGYLGGTVDFLVLKSLSMITSELSDFRKTFYKTETNNALTMRPFTLHELSGLIKTVQELKRSKFPRSQLYQLRQAMELGRHISTLDYLYFRSRLNRGDGKLLQEQVERNWRGAADTADSLGPWYAKLRENKQNEKCYETLLLDLIEAYDFILEPE